MKFKSKVISITTTLIVLSSVNNTFALDLIEGSKDNSYKASGDIVLIKYKTTHPIALDAFDEKINFNPYDVIKSVSYIDYEHSVYQPITLYNTETKKATTEADYPFSKSFISDIQVTNIELKENYRKTKSLGTATLMSDNKLVGATSIKYPSKNTIGGIDIYNYLNAYNNLNNLDSLLFINTKE